MIQQAVFTPIDRETWSRTPYYDYYRNVLKQNIR